MNLKKMGLKTEVFVHVESIWVVRLYSVYQKKVYSWKILAKRARIFGENFLLVEYV